MDGDSQGIGLGLYWWPRQSNICLQCRRPRFDPGLHRSPGEGNGSPLQYSCLENPMDSRAWQATVHESDTTERLHFHFHFPIKEHLPTPWTGRTDDICPSRCESCYEPVTCINCSLLPFSNKVFSVVIPNQSHHLIEKKKQNYYHLHIFLIQENQEKSETSYKLMSLASLLNLR